MNSEALARSVDRLTRMRHPSYSRMTAPEILIEAELAIAVRRFGVRRVVTRIIQQTWDMFWLSRRFRRSNS